MKQKSISRVIGISTSWDDLMGETNDDLSLRIFNTIAGATIVGICLAESEDSFLVGLPGRLMQYDNDTKRQVEPHIAIPFMRSMKSTMLTVLPIYGDYELYYLKYLLTEGKVLSPDVIIGDYEKKLTARLEYIQSILTAISGEVTKEEQERVTSNSEETGGTFDTSLVVPPSRLKH